MERPPTQLEQAKESLESITLAEYKNLPEAVQEWLVPTERIPDTVVQRLAQIGPQTTLQEYIVHVRDALIAASGGREIAAQSREESRNSTLEEIIKKGIRSCGSRVKFIGFILREQGIPVRLVDGLHVEGDKQSDHAWLDIYAPKTGTWIECDVMKNNLRLQPQDIRKGAYHDWSEL